jgi:hypothetical protein
MEYLSVGRGGFAPRRGLCHIPCILGILAWFDHGLIILFNPTRLVGLGILVVVLAAPDKLQACECSSATAKDKSFRCKRKPREGWMHGQTDGLREGGREGGREGNEARRCASTAAYDVMYHLT